MLLLRTTFLYLFRKNLYIYVSGYPMYCCVFQFIFFRGLLKLFLYITWPFFCRKWFLCLKWTVTRTVGIMKIVRNPVKNKKSAQIERKTLHVFTLRSESYNVHQFEVRLFYWTNCVNLLSCFVARYLLLKSFIFMGFIYQLYILLGRTMFKTVRI